MTDPKILERLILKSLLVDKDYLASLSSVFEDHYFDDTTIGAVYSTAVSHFKEYGDIPDRTVVLASLAPKVSEETQGIFREVDAVEFDVVKSRDWLLEETNKYLKDKAIKKAILDSVDIIEDKKGFSEIRKLVENALCKDLKIDLGLDYFGDIVERLNRMASGEDIRIPTYFPFLDEITNGGLPPKTLSVITARPHGGKSQLMGNIAMRQVLAGKNVVLTSLEMSQDIFAQRFDALISNIDVNRMYRVSKNFKKLQKDVLRILKAGVHGNMRIKEYPPRKASVNDFRIYLRELKMRRFEPDIFYCDYINLMRPEGKSQDSLYVDVKIITEELRALSYEFNIPVVSVTQLNREGTFTSLPDLDFAHISESMGVAATVDFMAVMGQDPDSLVYESEVHWKVLKNRLGGRVGEIGKWYFDTRTLKFYDESERDIWLADAAQTGDSRNPAQTRDQATSRRGRRRSE